MASYVPSFSEQQNVGEGHARLFRFRSENAEDRRINVIPRDTANINELRCIILVRNVARLRGPVSDFYLRFSCDLLSVPRYDIEGRMFLVADVHLTCHSVSSLK